MGELIRREMAAKPAAFSGERLTSAVFGQVETEHYHRYLLARDYRRGRDVLDVASGEGYGTALLAQVAHSAVGVEIDEASVQSANAEFRRPNLRFEQGDARELPLAEASVDIIVSFETIEHFDRQEAFLAEVRRVLRPGGLFIVSTPDREVYSPLGTPPNPFHVWELTRTEFDTLLRHHFTHVALAEQRPIIGSVILNGSSDAPPRVFERRGTTHVEACNGLPRAPYLIAFASDSALPPLPSSLYVERSDLDTDRQARAEAEQRAAAEAQRSFDEAGKRAAAERACEQARQAQKLAETLSEQSDERARAEAARAAAALEEASAWRAEAGVRAEAEAERARLEMQARETANELLRRLQAIDASTAWRVTTPFRNFGVRHPSMARLLRRSLKLTWWAATLQLNTRLRARRDALESANRPVLAGDPSPPPAELDPAGLRIPTAVDPVVSVIIPTYGQVRFTLRCLASIAKNPSRTPFEIIVIDDASEDPEVARLNSVSGIALIRNARNMGFLRTCNAAAKAASGRYLLFLNNDTEVRPGAIDALCDLLDARPDAGIAGSKLIFPDGRLQEAGGIIWNDGSGWNYGRNDDPTKPEYCYVREVDYCSGAAILIRRSLFEELGGFDETFAPAYYEDTDLAFRVRAHGLKVLFEPRSVVVHHEGVSNGTDLTTGVKAHQASNQERMLVRWQEILRRDHFEPGTHVLRARERARYRRVILVADHYVPEHDRDAGSRSTLGILSSLVACGWVVKFWPHNRAYSPTYTPALEAMGVEVIDHRWSGDFANWLRVWGADLDHVMLMRPTFALDMLAEATRGSQAVTSFYGHDLHFERLRRQAVITDDAAIRREADAMERLERGLWRMFDVVAYVSEEEAAQVRALEPGTNACAIVPFCFDRFERRAVPPEGSVVLFVAGFAHPPNVDAAEFLVRDIWPVIEAARPDARLVLAGSNPTDAVRALASDTVEVTGYVSEAELARLYATSRAAVIPLRFGAGVKGKVAQALSEGLPLVTTPVGAEGIAGLAAVAPVREGATGIADALLALLSDDAAWIAQSAAQAELAERRFSRAAMRTSLIAALEAGERARNAQVPATKAA